MTTTIQGTSKNLKGALLLSYLLILLGIVLAMILGSPKPLGLCCIGLLSLLVTKFLIWWNHA